MDVVTGAFSFSGKYIAARLLAADREVRTLTRHPQSASPFGKRVRAFPLDFDDVDGLTEILRGADTLEPTVRDARVHDVAARLRLQHLSTFFERVAIPHA